MSSELIENRWNGTCYELTVSAVSCLFANWNVLADIKAIVIDAHVTV